MAAVPTPPAPHVMRTRGPCEIAFASLSDRTSERPHDRSCLIAVIAQRGRLAHSACVKPGGQRAQTSASTRTHSARVPLSSCGRPRIIPKT
eukprot:scaffold63404_cov35-Tisochrysis_lutea.AAC.3